MNLFLESLYTFLSCQLYDLPHFRFVAYWNRFMFFSRSCVDCPTLEIRKSVLLTDNRILGKFVNQNNNKVFAIVLNMMQ